MSKKLDNVYLEIQRNKMKSEGVNNPVRVECFVEEIYNMIKGFGFSVIEFETIVNELLKKVAIDKRLVLKTPLTKLDKYKGEEGK